MGGCVSCLRGCLGGCVASTVLLVSTQTFRRALTTSVDSCADIRVPFNGITNSGNLEESAGKRCSECGPEVGVPSLFGLTVKCEIDW